MEKETIVDLQQAYNNRVERVYHPDRYFLKKLKKERKANGVCVLCGRRCR